MALEKDQEKVMPYYEFECDYCGYVIEKFYRSIPRIDPTHLKDDCPNCLELDTSFKKVLSLNTFHLKGGKVPWGEGRFSSASSKSDDVVEINEP
jgi:putative FmdB family regulatory protein